jgi:2-polyprenyl-3-methyl-5-hydroxy-6-metoxy-1,4-benzoquinol methylase
MVVQADKTQAAQQDASMAAQIDEARLHQFLGRVVGDVGALGSAPLVLIGEQLGLYDAMAEMGPITAAELAQRTGTVERYVAEWLQNQAAGGYVEYDPATGRYTLPLEHAVALPNLYGAFQLTLAAIKAAPRIAEAFRTGGGVSWGEHDPDLFLGCERFFRPGYEQNLVQAWIPALDGVEAKLRAGGVVADVGCGHGASTTIMASAYPSSRFVGFDTHGPSIEKARRAAEAAGLDGSVSFEMASALDFPAPGQGYDLITFFDCVHDMADPTAALRRAARTLAPGGTVMMVEPMAGERIEENLNPVGRVYSSASVLVCTANARAGGGVGIGTLAPESRLRELAHEVGFTSFRRAAETPFNRVFEARR